jgi:hypothetical protein
MWLLKKTTRNADFLFFSELYSNGNVALGKFAYSSSIHRHDLAPEFVVDGILDHGVHNGGAGCFASSNETKPYLQIHLEREYRIIFIRMFNRYNCCGNASYFFLKPFQCAYLKA